MWLLEWCQTQEAEKRALNLRVRRGTMHHREDGGCGVLLVPLLAAACPPSCR